MRVMSASGKERRHPTYGYNIQPKDNVKMAIVQLVSKVILVCREEMFCIYVWHHFLTLCYNFVQFIIIL